jgi:SPP1 family holin
MKLWSPNQAFCYINKRPLNERTVSMANEKMKIKTVSEVVEVPVEAPKVNPGLVVATIIYLIAIINAGAALFGFDVNIQANQDMIYEGVTAVFTFGSFIIGVYKNHNYTKQARIKAAAAEQVRVIRK